MLTDVWGINEENSYFSSHIAAEKYRPTSLSLYCAKVLALMDFIILCR